MHKIGHDAAHQRPGLFRRPLIPDSWLLTPGSCPCQYLPNAGAEALQGALKFLEDVRSLGYAAPAAVQLRQILGPRSIQVAIFGELARGRLELLLMYGDRFR